MKLTKTDEEIIDYRQTKNYNLTLENNKGETLEIIYQVYTSNDPISGYDNDEFFFNRDGDEIITDYLEDFLGDDYDDLHDLLQELK